MSDKNEVIISEVIEQPLNIVIENITNALRNITTNDKVEMELSAEKQVVRKSSNDGKTIEVFTRQIFGNTEITSTSKTYKTTAKERRETVKALRSTHTQEELAKKLGVKQPTISKDLKRMGLK